MQYASCAGVPGSPAIGSGGLQTSVTLCDKACLKLGPCRVNHDAYSDAYIRDILTRYRTIAMVGASPNTSRPSYFAMKYLKAKGFRVIPVNPGQAGKEILGERVYASLGEIEEKVDIVDIFRASGAALAITGEAIAIGAHVVDRKSVV